MRSYALPSALSIITNRDSPVVFVAASLRPPTPSIKLKPVQSTAPEPAVTSKRPPNGSESRHSGHVARLRGTPVPPSADPADDLARAPVMPTPFLPAARASC